MEIFWQLQIVLLALAAGQELNQSELFCRTETELLLPYPFYAQDTCARCYNYLPDLLFNNVSLRFQYDSWSAQLVDPSTGELHFPDPWNLSSPLRQSFKSESFVAKWAACCQAALECCVTMATVPLQDDDNEALCPRTWDGWTCWSDTTAGSKAEVLCPPHVYFLSEPPDCPRYATKECLQNGTWFKKDRREWTSYEMCGRPDVIRRMMYFHVACYSVSIVFLIPALIIFSIYKQLRVHRVTMHRHLFTSLLLNGVFFILFTVLVMLEELDQPDRVTLIEQNTFGCKLLQILTKYFRMTNYLWSFCEGFYLHMLIAAAFTEQKTLVKFYILGWGFPLVPVTVYSIIRTYVANEKCWALPHGAYEWIFNGPNLLSLVLNLVFLCNIIRVLVTKLRATHANEPSQYRKAVKATLVLVPLFGLHFILVIYRPQSAQCWALEAYTYFSHAMDGLQGFWVALIFCYLNGETQALLLRSLQRYRLQHKLSTKADWRCGTTNTDVRLLDLHRG